MSVMTLQSLESGSAGVTMGAYLSVMHVLGVEQDLNRVGAADETGRRLQDAQLLQSTSPKVKKPEFEQRTTAANTSKPPSVQTDSVIGKSYLSERDLRSFPLNTHSLSALLTRKNKPDTNS